MRVVILSSTRRDGLASFLAEELRELGDHVALHDLRQERFAPCGGCFDCWIRTPGRCKMRDAANPLMQDVIQADGVLWLVEPRFGSWDPVAKAALDRSLALLSPFFEPVEGETHHRARYPEYPRWAVIAVGDLAEDERALFRTLVARNGLNMHAPRPPWVGFEDEGWLSLLGRARLSLSAPAEPDGFPQLKPYPSRPDASGLAGRHAVLWVGSAKPKGGSTSEAYGRQLLAHLEEGGWSSEVVYSASATKLGRSGSPRLAAAFERADLIVPAAPVYWDSVPALVLAGLPELLGLSDKPRAMLPIVQCGFPELAHTRLAVEVFAQVASNAGLAWAGHLAVAGAGAPRGELPPYLKPQREALAQAAQALSQGAPVPAEVIARFGVSPLKPGAYRLMAHMGWLAHARENRAVRKLGDTPFE